MCLIEYIKILCGRLVDYMRNPKAITFTTVKDLKKKQKRKVKF